MVRTSRGKKRRERRHLPAELGPRIIFRGRYASADLRPWGGERVTLRDPTARGWPDAGDRTEDPEVAARWARLYVEAYNDQARRKHLGLKQKPQAIGELLDVWLKLRKGPGHMQVEPATYSSNVSVSNRLREWAGEDTPIDAIRGKRQGRGDDGLYLQDYFNDLLVAGYARSTVQTERAILSGFFNWADHPIVGETKVPAPEEKDIFNWSDEQLTTIESAADRIDTIRKHPFPQARLAVELALGSGARQQELFALSWPDIKEQERTIRIWRQHNRIGGFKQLKGKENRTVLLLPRFFDYLDAHVSDWRERKGLILNEGGPTKLVRYARTIGLIQRILDTANLNEPGRGWHDFRRTYGRIFLELTGGSGLHLLQVYLGHKDLKTTQKSYGHLSSEHATRIGKHSVYGDGKLRVAK